MVKREVTLGDLFAERRVVELRESAQGHGIQETFAQHLFADRAQVGRTILDQRAQGSLARVELGLGVEDEALDFVESAAVAEDDVEFADTRREGGRSVGECGGGESVPRGGLGGAAPTAQTIREAVEDVGLKRGRTLRGEGKERVDGRGVFLEVFAQAARDQLAGDRQRAGGGDPG